MDHYNEQLVAKRRNKTDILKVIGIVVGAILIAAVCMFFAMQGITILVLLAVAVLGAGIWMIRNINIEYEYIITNNEMDIDKIIGQRKRKRMITVDLSKAEEFAEYPPNHDVEADATVHASSGLEKDAHYLLLEHGEYGKVKIIFNPNKKTQEAIVQELPRALRAKVNQNVK